MTGLWFFFGVAAGVAIAIPLAVGWNRATARRIRQLEQSARTNERLAEVGALTSGLAHEIKNPLSTVGLNVQLIQEDLRDFARELPADSDLPERMGRTTRRFDTVVRETQRLRAILEDFLRFAGRMELDRSPVSVNEMLDELADFFEPQAAEAKVHLRRKLDANPDVIEGDEGLLKQAILNLMINAVQAMSHAREKSQPHGGADELIVSTQTQRAAADGAEICIQIMDTGPGIDDALARRIFEPYFSTKRSGTGLGLPTARRIAEEHGGTLTVHAEPGRGTAFTLKLPARRK